MTLILTPFANAVERLAEGLDRHGRTPDDAQLRDGLIQRFEFTYDLAQKTLRRALALDDTVLEDVDQMTFATMIRTAWARGLTLHEWSHWRAWRDMCNISSHTYDEGKARLIVDAIPDFLAAARETLARIAAADER